MCDSRRRGKTYRCPSVSTTLYDSRALPPASDEDDEEESAMAACRMVEMHRSRSSMNACDSAGSSSVGVAEVGSARRRTWLAKGRADRANGLSIVARVNSLVGSGGMVGWWYGPSLSMWAARASRSMGGPSSFSVGRNCRCLWAWLAPLRSPPSRRTTSS